MGTTNGTKYTFICDPDDCDSLVEITTVDGFGFPNGAVRNVCPCGKEMQYISMKVLSSQSKKEALREALIDYLQLLTSGDILYNTAKVAQLRLLIEEVA